MNSKARFATLGLAAAVAGCVNPAPYSPMAARRAPDMPAPLGAQEDIGVARPSLAGPHESNKPIDKLGKSAETQSPELESADVDEPPGPALVPAEPSLGAVPKIERLDVSPGTPLELTVTAPARRPVGGDVTYRMMLRNTGEQPLERLVVHCRFDEALFLKGVAEHDVRRRIERLAPGESKEFALTLTGTASGSHVCHFVVTKPGESDEQELLSRQVAVEFVTRQIEIDVVGPAQRTEGSRAEFNITLSNRSEKLLSGVQATISFDKALVAKEASAEAEQKPGSLVWRLGALEPNETVQLQVEFECRSRAHRACVAVEVRAANLRPEQDEACLEIGPVAGTLDLAIADRGDPYEPGKSGTYELTVQNIGLQVARKVLLEAQVPEHLKFLSASVRQGDEELSLKWSISGAKVLFEPIGELDPGARLVYLLEVEALRPGTGELRASLTSSLSGTPTTSSEPTVVTEP